MVVLKASHFSIAVMIVSLAIATASLSEEVQDSTISKMCIVLLLLLLICVVQQIGRP